MAILCLSVSSMLAVTQASRATVSRMELSATLQLSACLKYALSEGGRTEERILITDLSARWEMRPGGTTASLP